MNVLDVDPSPDDSITDQKLTSRSREPEQLALPVGIVIPQSQQAPISKKQRRLESLDPSEFPKPYRQNSDREIAQLEYVEHYRRQFLQLFPLKPNLYLCPMNECGVRKFVCSTIRPTLLKYPRTYDLQQTATFVADFVNYIPLETPTLLPDFLPSPSTIVAMREGDCVDLSTLLVSVLRGAGFRAYVVSGYAPVAITLQDLTSVQCPLLKTSAWDDDVQIKDLSSQLAAPAATEQSSNNRYNVHRDRTHVSKHLQMLAEREAAESAHLAEESAKRATQAFKYQDPYQDRRVHCWVMVLPGRRDISNVQFIEPSTGIIYQLNESPYQRIESLWNESNYWINIQKPCELKDLYFDLDDSEAWEYIIVKDKVNKGERIFDPKISQSPRNSKLLLLEASSWTSKIVIPSELIKSVFPDGQKILYFNKCNLEKFAPLLPGKQGLVLRLTLFEDDARQNVIEIRELFDQRKDNLIKRVILPETNCVKLRYAPGKPSGIQDLIEIPGVQRLIRFYPKSRVDGLIKRTEMINKKFVEEYQGCENRLIHRAVVVDESDSKMRRLKGFSINPGGANELPVVKFSERFARNPAVPADENIKKKVSLIDQGKIAIHYHYGPGRVTASSKIYSKEGAEILTWNVDGNTNPLQSAIVREEFNALVQSEKELMSIIRQRESELNEMLNQLKAELEEAALERNGEDKPRTKSKEQVKSETGNYEDNEHRTIDYLAPFLAQFPTGKPLLREQAEQARDECMASLTERLLKRGNIIQRRLNEEYDKLKKRETAYQRNQGPHVDKEEEEYNAFYESTMFRIHILEARLHRHEKMAMKKFRALDLQLRVDPRLEALYKPQPSS